MVLIISSLIEEHHHERQSIFLTELQVVYSYACGACSERLSDANLVGQDRTEQFAETVAHLALVYAKKKGLVD